MKITTIEGYHQNQHAKHVNFPDYYQKESVERDLATAEAKRSEVDARFCHAIVVEASWPEFDMANRWCWQNVGPQDGQCVEYCSEYPGCPLVLATKHLKERPPHMSQEDWEDEWHDGYRNPGDHGHDGDWIYVHLGKTGYDYGFGEYRFVTGANRDAFASVVESFDGH